VWLDYLISILIKWNFVYLYTRYSLLQKDHYYLSELSVEDTFVGGSFLSSN